MEAARTEGESDALAPPTLELTIGEGTVPISPIEVVA